MTESTQVARATQNHLSFVIEAMFDAFYNDPFITYLAPDEMKRTRMLPTFLGMMVNYCFVHGEVWTTPLTSGASCWLVPGKTSATTWGMLQAGMLSLPFKLGWAGFQRLMDVVNFTETVHKQVVTEPHWYLWGLGVDPAYQRQGVGGNLISPVLEKADAAKQPCYLETQNASNLPFYRKHGFDVVSDKATPGGLPVWVMLRKPQQQP